MQDWINNLQDNIYETFIYGDRWKYFADGVAWTLKITFFALIIGIVIGALVAIIRSTYDKQYSEMSKGVGKAVVKILNIIAKIYLTIFRGTPVVVQIMIMYYIVLVWMDNDLTVASIAFGINSGAYVAEIFRSGIMSIDVGQFEAGRSLGFNYAQTMIYVIIPQAFKNVLPTLANEFIVLLKETSVAGYVGIAELTKGGDIVRSIMYKPFFPLISVALIYLVMVMFFTWLVGILERRLRNDER